MEKVNSWRLPRLLLAIAGVVLLVALTTQSGHADTGSTNDPNDVAGKLDVSNLAHADSGTLITYTVTTYDDFAQSDSFSANWTLQNAAGTTFANVLASSNGTAFSGEVVDDAGAHIADATVTHPSSKQLLVTYPRSALGNITSYKYFFVVSTSADTDRVPDTGTATHSNLAAPATTTSGPSTSTTSGATSTTTGGSGSGSTTTAPATTSTTKASTTTTVRGSGSGSTTTTAAGGATTTTSGSCAPKVTVSPSTVAAGKTVLVTGTCLAPNADDTVVLTSNPVLLGTVHTDGNGNFSGNFIIPANTPPGAHSITVSGAGTAAAATITVGPKELSFTGRNAARAIGVAIALVFAGAVLFAGRLLGDQHEDYIREL